MAECPTHSEEVAKPSGLEVFENMDAFELLDDYEKFSSSIRLSFAKFSTGYKINDFDNFIREYVGQDQLESIGRLKYPNEWFMKVKSKELREKLLRIGRVRINERCCWLSPLSQKEVRGKVHWLPSTIANDKLKAVLAPFGQIIFIEVEGHPTSCAASTAQSDVRYFSLFLKSGKTAEDLPHFCNIDGFTGLFIIRGRAPACFTCHEIGHKKDECKWYLKKRDSYCNRDPRIDGPRVRRRGKRHKKKSNPTLTAAAATQNLPGKQNSAEKDASASGGKVEGQRKKLNPKVKSDAAIGTSQSFTDTLVNHITNKVAARIASISTPQNQRNKTPTSKVDAAAGTSLSFSNKPIHSEEGAVAACGGASASSLPKSAKSSQNKHTIVVHRGDGSKIICSKDPSGKVVSVPILNEGSTSRNMSGDGKNHKVVKKDAGMFPISQWSTNDNKSSSSSTQKSCKEQQPTDMENFVETLQRSAHAIKALESQLANFKFNPNASNNAFAGAPFQEQSETASGGAKFDSRENVIKKSEEACASIPEVSEGNEDEKKSKSKKKKNKKKKKSALPVSEF